MARFVAGTWATFFMELPRIEKLHQEVDKRTTMEVTLQYAKEMDERLEEMKSLRKKLGWWGFLSHMRAPNGPLSIFCREHDTTVDAMDRKLTAAYKAGDKEVKASADKW